MDVGHIALAEQPRERGFKRHYGLSGFMPNVINRALDLAQH